MTGEGSLSDIISHFLR